MSDRVQLGATLYFQTTEPTVGQRIQTRDGEAIIQTVTESPQDGGWLFTVEHERLPVGHLPRRGS
jgi:hypothetical protein